MHLKFHNQDSGFIFIHDSARRRNIACRANLSADPVAAVLTSRLALSSCTRLDRASEANPRVFSHVQHDA
jgi:hypothetical protein